MPEEQEFQRRLASVFRKISDVKPDDIRVCITGRVIDVQGDVVVLDDGSGKVNATFKPQRTVGHKKSVPPVTDH